MCIELLVRISCSSEDYTGGVFLNNAVNADLIKSTSFSESTGQTTANQQALHTHLFTSYDAGEKPYCGGAVNVTLDLALRQVIDLVSAQPCLSVCLSACLSVCLSVCPSSCLSRPARTDNFVMQPKLF